MYKISTDLRLTTTNHGHSAKHSTCAMRPGIKLLMFLLVGSVLVSLSSCSIDKYLPEDKYLYRGASVKVEAPDSVSTSELKDALEQTLNTTTNVKYPLIGYRPIWRWYRFQERKEENPEKYKDKKPKGSEPIFYDDKLSESVAELMENRAANHGYFQHDTKIELDTNKNDQEISVNYTVSVSAPYTLHEVIRDIRDTSIANVLENEEIPNLLKSGDRFDLNKVKQQRNQWERALRYFGYYYTRADDFIFLADTIDGHRQVDMLARLKPDVPPRNLVPQYIRNVNVHTDVSVLDTFQYTQDTILANGLKVICESCPIRPDILSEAIIPREGQLYDPIKHEKTLRRLSSYNTFRYISMSYDPVSNTDSLLDLSIYLKTQLKRRFEGELGLAYNSARYIGPNGRIAYRNRNLFRGAELLSIEADASMAVFLGNRDESRIPQSGTYTLTTSLNVPRLWVPWRIRASPRIITSSTYIEVAGKLENLGLNLKGFLTEIEQGGYDELAQRIEEDPDARESVNLLQLSARYGYIWQQRQIIDHQFYPLSFRYQDPIVRNGDVLNLARGLGVSPGSDEVGPSRFDRMFLISPEYVMNYDDRRRGRRKHNFFVNQKLSMNYNTIYPVDTRSFVIGNETSWYPLVETDARYYLNLNSRRQVAARLHGGVAFPFSKRAIVPYFDLFTIGGPNSLRGFVPRQLGPGRTAPINNNLLTFGGYGNVLLEASLEYRQQLNNLFEVAVFGDAGNVWTFRTELEPLNTDFKGNNFFKELALDAGVGLRIDLQFIILRLDVAKPLQIPFEDTLPEQDIPYQNIGDLPDKSWRFVVAFGYPF